ncbi:MAG: NERD domain-containing protein [Thermogemmatispora sp.]|uniref:nuclease-related domain-containing protein n=1 Tax=Thermogemmatispora sp. TaxID=1968838 RepID=UPI0026380A73|nr:nuclease-related domain-containing protein [Thermogemmatispora sp.]MBX5459028.1 NERD domain-containing protein [Thermogemmatispora sp.]
MASTPVPVPYEDQEAVIVGDSFARELARYGWQVQQARPPYTDPLVLRQRWLRCPNGSEYSHRQLYTFLLSTPCRHALRRLLERLPCLYGDLLAAGPGELPGGPFLKLLIDQELLLQQEIHLLAGPDLLRLHDLGHTFEWLVAEWLRLYGIAYYKRLVPVRHSVSLAAPALPGDIDVLAFLDEGPVLVECKTRTRTIEEAHFARFVERARLLRPFAAIFLIDSENPLPEERVSQCARALQQTGAAPLHGSGGFYFTAERIYLMNTSLSFQHRLTEALADARRRWRGQPRAA